MREPVAVRTEVVRLRLRHTWTTTMSSSDCRDVLFVYLTAEGITGVGEGAPIARYHEDAARAERAVASVAPLIARADLRRYAALDVALRPRLEGQWAAQAAISAAVVDWVGQRLGVPVHELFGLDPDASPVTSFSIGIDSPETTREKTREAADFQVLKVKVGLDSDEATIAAVRSVTDRPLRVDANEGWRDRELALERIRWLETMGVELIEQPMPADRFEDIRWLRERVSMPIFADEACLRPADVPRLAQAYDGVNIKLDKAGGILQAQRMIQVARAVGLRTMLGCMVSSSVAITAAAHLAPLVDFADLDGNLLLAHDPWRGVQVAGGRLVLPDAPGLGVRRVE